MRGSQKYVKTNHFFGTLDQSQFSTVFGKKGKTGIFFKKALGTFFSHLQALPNSKVSEKSNELIFTEIFTGRTNEQELN